MAVLVTWKNGEDRIKNVGTRVLTTLNNFPNAQGQVTPQSMVESCWISNSSEVLWLSLLPARMKKIRSEMKALECWQPLSHCKSMGIFSNAQGQLTPHSMDGSGWISNSSKTLWLSSLPARMKKFLSKLRLLECWQTFPHYKPMGAICCHGNQSSDLICFKT